MNVLLQTSEAPAQGRTSRRATRRPRTSLNVLLLAFAGMGFAVLQSSVAPALSAIAGDRGTSTSTTRWVLTAFLLSTSILTPILSRLGDMMGKRKVLLIVLAMLSAGIVVSALAGSLAVLIVGRALQGAAGAILPLSIGIGIVTAGPIVDLLGWSWVF